MGSEQKPIGSLQRVRTTENNFFWTCVNPKKGFASKYLVYRDVKCTKPHTIAENLILPAAENNIKWTKRVGIITENGVSEASKHSFEA